jgi:hypothetical protein
MSGNRKRWRSMAIGVMSLVGCVSLGDVPRESVAPKRPRLAAEQPPTTELRISDTAVAQAGNDIPIVPVPPLPTSRLPANSQHPSGGRQPPETGGTQGADAPRSGTTSPQADGSIPTHTARQLLEQAVARCATLDSYIVRLTRRESLKGKLGPEEIIAFSFRKQPFSVHFKWLGKTAEGREVVYVKGRYDNKIYTKVAAGDSLLLPAGARLALSPDNPLVRAASHHPITDAGICRCVESLAALLDAQERGDRRQGTLTVLPPQRRPEYPQPVETLERLIPPSIEPDLPRGGRRLFYFDHDWQLPMLVLTYDDKGNEIEYYHYDRMITPVRLDDDDFNPDKLWPSTNGRRPPAGRADQPVDAGRSPERR